MDEKAVIYFLADVHLSPERPDITATFSRTLTALASTASAVYILGDLFDYWLGDELATDFHKKIAEKIAALPCPVFYQHGNRDFLLGEDFAMRAGFTILPERFVLSLSGKRVLLEHGDLLCIDDVGYQRLRRILRSSLTQKVFSLLPKKLKERVARKLRAKSKYAQRQKTAQMVDTNQEEIARVMADFSVDVLIHGHTHRPAVWEVAGKNVFVVGDFRPEAKILRFQAGEFTLINSQ